MKERAQVPQAVWPCWHVTAQRCSHALTRPHLLWFPELVWPRGHCPMGVSDEATSGLWWPCLSQPQLKHDAGPFVNLLSQPESYLCFPPGHLSAEGVPRTSSPRNQSHQCCASGKRQNGITQLQQTASAWTACTSRPVKLEYCILLPKSQILTLPAVIAQAP